MAVALTLALPVLAPLPLMLLRRNGGRISFLTGAIVAVSLLIWLATPAVVSLFLAALFFAKAKIKTSGIPAAFLFRSWFWLDSEPFARVTPSNITDLTLSGFSEMRWSRD